jgi:hypothetical protein
VRGLGFSTHFSWNFGTFDFDQVEASMARYRENEEITKARNDQYLCRNGGLISKRERDKSSKSPCREKRGVEDDDAKARGRGSQYRYLPSPVQAFQSLVPMKTLILDLVRELLQVGAGGAEAGGGGGGGRAVEAPICSDRDTAPSAVSHIADVIKGSWTDREVFNITTPPPAHRHMTSAVAGHLQQVLQDSPLLVLLLLELASSVQQMRKDMSVALSVTSLKPYMEPYGSSKLHCERSSCSMELFEAYIDCPKCGIICLQCASGCGDAHKGGCVEGERLSPETVPFLPQAAARDQSTASPGTATSTDIAALKIASSGAEIEFRFFTPLTPVTSAEHAHAGVAIPHPLKAEVRAIQEPECVKIAPSPPPFPTPYPCTSGVKEGQSVTATVVHARVLHVHYPGARLLLKTPLTTLSKIVKDFAALVVRLYPEERERICSSPAMHPLRPDCTM